MLSISQINKLKKYFHSLPAIKLVYLFGSQALGETGPLSDYDFAFYLEGDDKKKQFELKLELMDNLSRILHSDKIDVVIINFIEGPELRYNIIKEGRLIYEVEPHRILLEPQILNEYFDFLFLLRRYNLTKV